MSVAGVISIIYVLYQIIKEHIEMSQYRKEKAEREKLRAVIELDKSRNNP